MNDPKRNPVYRSARTALWLAQLGRKIVLLSAAPLLAGVVIAVTPLSASAQYDERDSQLRQEFVDSLIRSLIDSERDRSESFESISQYDRPALPQTTTTTREMLQARRLLDGFSQETIRLTVVLNRDLNRVPELRAQFSDALKVRARSAVLSQRGAKTLDHRLIQADVESLDRDWRGLSYQLGLIRDLSSDVTESVRIINQHDRQLTNLLGIRPQLDRRELIRQTTALTVGLQNLLDDVEIDLARSPQRNQLLIDGRKAQNQARHVADTIANDFDSDYETIIAEYRKFQRYWELLATRLGPIENRYMNRHVRRIGTVDNTVNQLLWLPHQTDHRQLLHLTKVLMGDVDEFFIRAPLKLLIGLPESEIALSTADQFYGVCANFSALVSDGDSQEDLVEAYRYIEEAWEEFTRVYISMSSQKAQLVLKDVEQGIFAIRDSLQVHSGFDRHKVVKLIATIEHLADHLHLDMRQWLDRHGPTFATQADREANNFVTATRQFHGNLGNGTKQRTLRRQGAELFENWQRLHGYIARCTSEEKEHLQQTSAQLTPLLVELRTMLVPYAAHERLLDLASSAEPLRR